MLLIAKTRGLRRNQFSLCIKHIIWLRCYYERSKLPLPLIHTKDYIKPLIHAAIGDAIAVLHNA